MSKTAKMAWRANQLNQRTYINYYDRLKDLALNRFEWINLPPTVDERFLELTLYEYGYCLYFNDELIGNLALTCTIGGQLDVYRIPILRRAYATNGYQKMCSKKDSVIIFNNYTHTPTATFIEDFARRLTLIERTIDININAQRTPLMLLGSQSQKMSMEQAFQKYDGFIPFIFGDKDFNMNDISVLKTDAPANYPSLQVQKHSIWNEALTFLGIENSNQDKKERMVSDEVGSNYGNVEAQRNISLNARRQACEQINRMFGTDIWVNFNSNLATMVNMENVSRETLAEIEGGNTDGVRND